MAVYRFCYKVSAEAGLAHDGKGNKAPCYIEASMNGKDDVSQESYDRLHESLVNGLHKDLGIHKEFIAMITPEEYDENQGDDE